MLKRYIVQPYYVTFSSYDTGQNLDPNLGHCCACDSVDREILESEFPLFVRQWGHFFITAAKGQGIVVKKKKKRINSSTEIIFQR